MQQHEIALALIANMAMILSAIASLITAAAMAYSIIKDRGRHEELTERLSRIEDHDASDHGHTI